MYILHLLILHIILHKMKYYIALTIYVYILYIYIIIIYTYDAVENTLKHIYKYICINKYLYLCICVFVFF